MTNAARCRNLPFHTAAAISPLIIAASGAFASDSAPPGTSAITPTANSSSWFASIGAAYTDNIGASSTNRQSDFAPQAGLGLSYNDNRERLNSEVEALMSYSAYPTSLYATGEAPTPNPFFGVANVALTGTIVPGVFLWDLKDNYGITPVALASPDSPYNRQNTNVVETGPRALIPLGARNELQVAASWFTSSFADTSQADGTGEQGNVAIVHRMSTDTAVALGVSGSRIQYPASQSTNDFDIRSAYAEWSRVQSRGEILLKLGATQISSSGLEQQSPLASFTFIRETSAHGKLSLSLGREFSSSALAFQENQTFFGVTRSLTDVQATADPFRSDYGRISWEVEGLRWLISSQASYIKESFISDPLFDARLYELDASFGRLLSPRLEVDVRADYDHRQFASQSATADDRRIGAELSFILSSKLQLTASAFHYSGTNEGEQPQYTQNIVQLRLTYRHVAHR